MYLLLAADIPGACKGIFKHTSSNYHNERQHAMLQCHRAAALRGCLLDFDHLPGVGGGVKCYDVTEDLLDVIAGNEPDATADQRGGVVGACPHPCWQLADRPCELGGFRIKHQHICVEHPPEYTRTQDSTGSNTNQQDTRLQHAARARVAAVVL